MMSEWTSADSLRRYLLDLPSKSNFKFDQSVRKDIRRSIFLSISSGGCYLDWLYPKSFTNHFPNQQNELVVEKIDKEFDWLFSKYYKKNIQIRDPKYNSYDHHAFHSNLPCSRIFRKGEPIYRCLTCGYDDTCALCSHCYQPEFHEGHKVHITICQRANGGVCDCGDPEAWVNDFTCPYASADDQDLKLRNKPMPLEFEKSFLSTIEILLDYIIDVMSHADLQLYPDHYSDTSLKDFSDACSLDPTKYGYSNDAAKDPNSDKYFLMVYNDQIRHFRDAVQRIHLASKKVTPFAVMVAEKVQSFGKAKVISSSDLSLLEERRQIISSTGLASCIRSHRDIFREEMCDEILLFIKDFTESELFKINNNAKNLFCKAFCGKWNKGIRSFNNSFPKSQYSLGKLDSNFDIPEIRSINGQNPSGSHWYFSPSRWNLPESLCEDCDYNTTDEDYDLFTSHHGSRFQYLVYFDIRFWKSIRIVIHDMYSTSLITNLKYKRIICCQYVDIYPTIADMFLTLDREPELNIMSTLSTQLFTCPSNSTSIIQHGDISRIFASIYGFLSTGRIEAPCTVDVSHEIDMMSLKNRRWGQIFFDIGYILSRSCDSHKILSCNIIPMACDILALFQGRPVLRRESKNHVEYESPDYTAFFHAILVIYQFGEYIAQCLNGVKDNSPRITLSSNAINYVIQFLLRLELNEYPCLLDECVDIDLSGETKAITEPKHKTAIRDYRIDKGKVSFLHPIHSFLSWLIELSNFESIDDLKKVLHQSAHSNPSKSDLKSDTLTTIFEYPIRTIVLMSQIKSGFWVRNGFSVRTQLQLYRNTGLRESGYLRDLFLLQIFVNCYNPDTFCYFLFNRWLLYDGWISTNTSSGELAESSLAYDQNTFPYMVEECLNFFIHLLTEDLYLKGYSNEEMNELRIRNEIIHSLCFGPINYSKLSSHIPDHITSEKRFDLILEDMSVFSPPTGLKDTGVYRLKEEYLDQVNPYYFNYTANTKDDAIKFVKERINKKSRIPTPEVVITPKERKPEELGIYKHIGNFSTSEYFSLFLLKTLKFVFNEGVDKMDSLLETILHLIHICSLEQSVDYKKYGTFYEKFVTVWNSEGTSIAKLFYEVLVNEAFSNHHSKVRSIFKVFESKYHNIADILEDQIESFDLVKLEFNTSDSNLENEFECKKRIAKERQAKLMAKFKKQQSSFLKNNNAGQDLDYSDTEMEDFEEEVGWKFPEAHCILCQNASEESGPFGIITYISKSSEFRDIPFDDKYWFLKSFSDPSNLDKSEDCMSSEHHSSSWLSYMHKIRENNVVGPGFFHHNNVDNKLVSLTCGHGMHFQCYINFVNSNRSPLGQITRNSPENIEHREFLCPLCKAINNMFIPILWFNNNKSLKQFVSPYLSIKFNPLEAFKKSDIHDPDWVKKFTEASNLDIQEANILSPSAVEMIGSSSTANATVNQQHFRMLLSNMFQILSLLTFPQIFKADSVHVLVNSIKSAELSLRGTDAPETLILGQLSNNTLVNLRTLNEFRNTSLLMKINNWIQAANPKADAHVKMLAGLLTLSPSSFSSSVLERDFFELLVNTFPLPRSGFLFHNILKTCFVGHIMQSLYIISTEIKKHDFYVNQDYTILDIPFSSHITGDDASLAVKLFGKLIQRDVTSDESAVINDPKFGYAIYSMLLKSVTPFLRRAAIFAYVACAQMDTIDFGKFTHMNFESDKLCALLNIDSLSEIIRKMSNIDNSTPFEAKLFTNFVEHIFTLPQRTFSEDTDVRKSLEYPGIVKLTDLPERLDFFFTKYYYSDKYNNPNMTIEDPAICLFCSQVVDVQKSAIGCKEGQCTTHFLKECSNDVGIFLLPKDRSILLLHKNGGSFYEAPYLDQHGELPGESKKGKTLYLMKPRYDEFIRKVWLQHNVSNYIVRKLDSVMDAGGWDTL